MTPVDYQSKRVRKKIPRWLWIILIIAAALFVAGLIKLAINGMPYGG